MKPDVIWIKNGCSYLLYGFKEIRMDALGWEPQWDSVFNSHCWFTTDKDRAEATAFLLGAKFQVW